LIVIPGIANPNANQNGNGNVVAARAECNGNKNNGNQIRCYNYRGMGHLVRNCTVRLRRRDVVYLHTQLLIAQKEEAGIQLQAEEFDLIADAGDLDEIKEVNEKCILIANLQQASTSGTQIDKALVYDSDGLVEVHHDINCYDNDIFNMFAQEEYVGNIMEEQYLEQHSATVEETHTSNLQTGLDHTKEKLESCVIKKEKEYIVLWNNWYKKCEECKYDKISYNKAYNDMQNQIERLQPQLGDLKGKSSNTQCASNTLDPLSQKHEDENYSVTPLPKSTVIPKVGESNALSKLVTSNSASSSRDSTVVNNERVIAPGIFRINHFKASRVDNFVPNKHVKASVRTKPITVSQHHVITKKYVNSNTNGFSPKDVESTTRTRRPQHRNNPQYDKVPSKSKSSFLSQNFEKIEENHRNLQSSNNQEHKSSEYNNIKLAIQDEKSKIIGATCKQCLITANHDECVLQYVNGMKSRKKNKSANVSKSENQKKHKANVKKSKKSWSKESLASPRPSIPRTCLRWLPTGRIFDLCGKITASSNTKNESDTSVCDNASASNPQEPTQKSQNQRDLPRDTPIDRVEFLRTSRWRFHHILAESQSRPLTYSQSLRIHSTTLIKNLKKVLNSKDTLTQALINENFLKEHQSRSIQDYLKAKDQDIKFKVKRIKSKIKIQDHKHAKGTSKEFPSIQGSKIQDVTISEAISAMTTP
ncbi:hypothetical protein Tco_0898127, partial [Tanacetum coccineum]